MTDESVETFVVIEPRDSAEAPFEFKTEDVKSIINQVVVLTKLGVSFKLLTKKVTRKVEYIEEIYYQ